MDSPFVILFLAILSAIFLWRIAFVLIRRRLIKAMNKNAHDDALKLCRRALRIAPGNNSILTLRSYIYLQLHQYDAAMDDLNRIIENGHENAHAYMNRGYILLQNNEFDLALQDLNQAQSYGRRSEIVYLTVFYCKMILYWKQGEMEKSLKMGERAVSRFSRHSRSFLTRAYIRSFLGDIAGAIEDYTKAIELTPDSSEAYVSRGRLYLGMGENEKALADHSTAITFNSRYIHALISRLGVYMRMGELEKAKQDCDTLLLHHPDDPLTHYAYARFECDSGNYADAETHAAKALELAPDEAPHICVMAHIKLEQGEIEEARLLFEQANRAEPWYSDAYAGLAVYSWRKQSEDQAMAYWKKAVQFDRNFANIAWFKFNYSFSSMLEDAPQIIERFNQENPGSDEEPV